MHPLAPVTVDDNFKTATPDTSSSNSPNLSGHTPTLLSSGGEKDDSLTKRLVVPSASTPNAPKKAIPRARLLTSTAALEMLEEKEQKNKKELELKEQRKREREENKRKKEEDRKRKLEERARKTEEKAKEKEHKAAKRTRKASAKTGTTPDEQDEEVESNAPTCSTRSSVQPPQKKARAQEDTIDEGRCCVCFTSYEDDVKERTGKDWVMCACSRWLHEECADDCVLDNTGKERLCPLCLNVFVT